MVQFIPLSLKANKDKVRASGKFRGENMSIWNEIKKDIIQDIKPSTKERKQLMNFTEELIHDINVVLSRSGFDVVAELHGSIVHDTWISGQQDIDVFLVIEEYSGKEQLKQVLDILREKLDWTFTMAYAEHPYLKTEINGYKLDIVPCYRVGKNETLYSSTDRTPLHTRWIDTHLKDLGDEVRLLKQFLKTLDLYGAEIKVGGFSGYLCELLVVYYGGFYELMRAASSWGKNEVITFTDEEPKDFKDPLIVIDPVDRHRNVASALRKESYYHFISAANSFIKDPSMIFFEEEPVDASSERMLSILKKRPSDILFLIIEESKADVADVLWGQLRKSKKALKQKIDKKGFKVLRSTAWSNEDTRHILIFELESQDIPDVLKHIGPPAYMLDNVEEFIKIYRDNPDTIAGPEIRGDRWYVIIRRDYANIKDLMGELLSDGGRSIGVSKKLAVRILQHHRVLVNQEIESYLIEGFEDFLCKWVRGRPIWIE